jgi:hypothetical protein
MGHGPARADIGREDHQHGVQKLGMDLAGVTFFCFRYSLSAAFDLDPPLHALWIGLPLPVELRTLFSSVFGAFLKVSVLVAFSANKQCLHQSPSFDAHAYPLHALVAWARLNRRMHAE